MGSLVPDMTTKVVLNVYDLEDESRPDWIKNVNWYLYAMGLGLYHSAVEVNGREFAFGGHDMEGTGIFENPPRRAVGAVFREGIPLGDTAYSPEEVDVIVADIGNEFSGRSYNLFSRNCNNFADELGFRLTGSRAPLWINRLAAFGDTLRCMLPEGIDSPHLAPVQASQQMLIEAPSTAQVDRDNSAPQRTYKAGVIDFDANGRVS
mmetsp:Transcript_408/g.1391  ORF Transcript_408/g.1391 Transcript_408/m.1391 type:complete len:206 (-) Transcript_408:465-1082(-)|eukprot:CAMPEP_0198731076 /NCGR_PEP_ID=MMETSP1475-20131203/28004_1 /TAXON_ID= ORGANISM="Unidentified sp., Strain CCMP1999" /NCGR_SAMPLE_ID=MMETSP1475 /ASSEMBLY_ACC=CAM_ASM_001111 /LENGTH=205 /DNA_ID=CAMNT_0044493987 /DNA_START=455 /DNA_END=1072 /DNA_ORIENTATION=-